MTDLICDCPADECNWCEIGECWECGECEVSKELIAKEEAAWSEYNAEDDR